EGARLSTPPRLDEQVFGTFDLGEEREILAVVRLVDLPLRGRGRAHTARLSSFGGDLPDLPDAAAVGGEEHGGPTAREAREHVVAGVVGQPPRDAAPGGDDVEV